MRCVWSNTLLGLLLLMNPDVIDLSTEAQSAPNPNHSDLDMSCGEVSP